MDHHLDGKNKRLGRLASQIAGLLLGKQSPAYAPNRVSADRVLLKNYRDVVVSGSKATQKIYYRHTGYMGHLKELSFEEAFAKDPKKVIRETVRRMLPKNFLNQKRVKKLIFIEND